MMIRIEDVEKLEPLWFTGGMDNGATPQTPVVVPQKVQSELPLDSSSTSGYIPKGNENRAAQELVQKYP